MELILLNTERKFIQVVAEFVQLDVLVETAVYHALITAPSHTDALVMGRYDFSLKNLN